ncbi:MAG TPA: LCP family protein [Bacillota bacterium]
MLLLLAAMATLLVGWVGSASGRTVLILGVDRREGDRGRSDTMLLVAPHVFGGGLKLLSIPRDTRVELPGRGTAKINAAYAFDGPEASAEAVAALLGIPVPEPIVVDFDAVAAVVDAMGGVTLTVERRMRYRDPYQDLVIDLEPGTQRLDGQQALGFVRFRSDAQADIGRTARQRLFVQAALAQLLAPDSWGRLPAVYAAVREHTETAMGPLALLRFGAAAAVAALWGVDEAVVPGRTASIDGVSYWLHDPEETALLVDRWFGRWAFSGPAGEPAAGEREASGDREAAGERQGTGEREAAESPPADAGTKTAGAGEPPANGTDQAAVESGGEQPPAEEAGGGQAPDHPGGETGDERSWDRGEAGAREDVAALLIHLAGNDPQGLASFLTGRTRQPIDGAGAAEILFLFHDYLDSNELEIRLLAADQGAASSQYDFGLFGRRNGEERVLPLTVLYRSEPPHAVLAGVLLNQGPWVRPYLARYLELLKAGDAETLARFLTVDDVDYPVDLARQALDRYAAEAAVDTLAFEYDGFGPLRLDGDQVVGNQVFHFTIHGRTPAGEALEHQVQVVVGDGLLSLQDPWVPTPGSP